MKKRLKIARTISILAVPIALVLLLLGESFAILTAIFMLLHYLYLVVNFILSIIDLIKLILRKEFKFKNIGDILLSSILLAIYTIFYFIFYIGVITILLPFL